MDPKIKEQRERERIAEQIKLDNALAYRTADQKQRQIVTDRELALQIADQLEKERQEKLRKQREDDEKYNEKLKKLI
jgi:hypothetical protein